MTAFEPRRPSPLLLERGANACLLIHGLGGSPAEIRPLAEYLADRSITVRAPLLPGHGTDPDDLRRTRWPQWVRAAEAELEALRGRYPTVHVVGFSMGGLVALHLAAHTRVDSVVTLSCPSRLADWRQFLVPLAKYFMKDYPARVSNPEIAAQLESYDRFPVAAIHSMLRLARQVRKELPRIQAPLLALQGDRDKWIAPDSADFILANVSSLQKQRILLPGRNHMIALEHGREEVFHSVHNWLASS